MENKYNEFLIYSEVLLKKHMSKFYIEISSGSIELRQMKYADSRTTENHIDKLILLLKDSLNNNKPKPL
jgi:hypothetical protein